MSDENQAISEYLKQLGQFSSDGLQVAINATLNASESETLNQIVQKLFTSLPKTPSKAIKKKKTTTVHLPSSSEVFKSKILPQVRQRLASHATNEMQGIVQVNSIMEFHTKYNNMTLDQIKDEHAKILMADEKVKNVQLFIAFHRGLLYLETSRRYQQETNFDQWILNNLGISYAVATRYMTVTLLIRRCPRLLICGLSFDQLAKHNQNFLKYFSDDEEGLQDSLAVTCEINVLGKTMVIKPREVNVPALEFKNLDPDSSYYPTYNENCDEDELSKWMPADRIEMSELLFPSDDHEMDTIATTAAGLSMGSTLPESLSSAARGHGRGWGRLP